MKKSLAALFVIVAATPALAQVRPENCVPVFPLVDKVAAVLPEDLTVPQATPAAAAKKGFFGLPLLLPLLLAGGVGGALLDDLGNNSTVSPA